jgi:hypothetical protein
MPATVTPQQAPTVNPPKHPLHALATFELRDYRRDLERAIAFWDTRDPAPLVRGALQADLDAVISEQDDRTKLADADA